LTKTINKNKQLKQRSHHDTWNTRHVRDTRSMHNAGELTSSSRDTVPRQQDKREQRRQQQQNTMLFGRSPKIRGCLLFVLWPCLAETREVDSFFSDSLRNYKDFPSDGQSPSLGARCVKLAQTLADVIIENQFLISTIDSSHH
jgi:hypothetical protein